LKFYTNPFSPNCRRVALVAKYAGIDLDVQLMDFAKGDLRKPEFLQLNLPGRVPVLTDGDLTLTESRAIVQYLAGMKPEAQLLGADAKEKASVLRWQFFDACHFSPHLSAVAFEKLVKGMLGLGEPSPATVKEALEKLEPNAKALDAQLKGRDWLVGTDVTLADLTIAASLMYAQVTEVPLERFSHIQSWMGRVRELDAWRLTEPKTA
jgi:glutathione S-transferase